MTRALAVLGVWLGVAALAAAQPASFTPLTDMGSQTYLGFRGGLYPDGNAPPPDHAALGLTRAALVRPLDGAGNPSTSGKIALLSIGASNTTQEFCSPNGRPPCRSWSFVGQALADPEVNRSTLVFVNGARAGETAQYWASPTDENYDRVRDTDLASAGLTEAQVQVAWVKVANTHATQSLPASDSDAYRLLGQMGDIARALNLRYQNLRLVYFSSLIYAGYSTWDLISEPYAYESGFAVKWLGQAQIDQVRNGGTVVDPRAGDLNPATGVPWLAWGPYLWGNGMTPRAADGFVWERADFEEDGIHASQSGEQKVGAILVSFFKSEPTARSWFLAAGTHPPPPSLDTRILTVVGSTPGALGTFFRTSVQLHNAGATPASGRIVFHQSGSSGSDSDVALPYLIGPGGTLSIADLLPAMDRSGLGSADILVASGPTPIMTARVFNDAGAAGTTGFTEEGMRPEEALQADQQGVLLVPADLAAYRMNIGVRTLEATLMTLTVRDAAGVIVAAVPKFFPAVYHDQQPATTFLNGLPPPAGGSVTVSIGAGSAIVYGATVDNRTGDPSLQIARATP